MRQRLLSRANIVLGAIITLLGVGCKSQKAGTLSDNARQETAIQPADTHVAVMYGVPNARYRIEGDIVAENSPAKDVQVTIRTNSYAADTVYTDEQGHFENISEGFPTDSVEVTVTDPHNRYLPATEKSAVEYNGKNGDWDYGTGTATFRISLRNKERDLQNIRVKYGVPRPPQTTISDN